MGTVPSLYQCDYVDPSTNVECPNTFSSGVSWSIVTQVPSPDPKLSGFACPVSMANGGQHQYCCWTHATGGQTQCLTNHLIPQRNSEIAVYDAANPTTPIITS